MTAVAATALMLALAAPALGLRLASSDAGNDPANQTTRQAYDLLAKGFGPGFNGPLQLAVALPRPTTTTALTALAHAVRTHARHRLGGSAAAQRRPERRRRSSPTRRPRRRARRPPNLVTRLRDERDPADRARDRGRVYVGGATASQVDFSHVLASKLPLFIAVVIALAALLLLVVFRSLVIPVQAALMNLLSIAASLGVVQAVFERGWLGGLFGVQAGPIDAFIPVLTFAIVFGLSMDYEVFLVSRVHEEWQGRRDASAAVREGLARTGRVITAAAAVMVAVFGAFAISGNRVLEMFGLAMASAVFLDAIVVRMLLLPAVLQLLGRTTWALPRWLDRRLPSVAIEAEPTPQPASVARAGVRGGVMTDQRTLDRLIAHLRGQVAELRRLERRGRRAGGHRGAQAPDPAPPGAPLVRGPRPPQRPADLADVIAAGRPDRGRPACFHGAQKARYTQGVPLITQAS